MKIKNSFDGGMQGVRESGTVEENAASCDQVMAVRRRQLTGGWPCLARPTGDCRGQSRL
ncbi:hypothetical protein [Streptomyces sp. NPDC002209]|uniref:hypothetical protein n=1 Tax=Streptomyces sp. NPDC002209 TaxID=3364638 RepID=UPI0036A29250